jgi:hypothetical protein
MIGEAGQQTGSEHRIIPFAPAEVTPSPDTVFDHQGIPAGAEIPDRIAGIHAEAVSQFAEVSRPVGIMLEIEGTDFQSILIGEGRNADDVLVAGIYPDADRLALFAATMGQGVSDRIEALFASNEFALGSMLDSVASQSADRAADILEERYRAELIERGLITIDHFVLGYSPGYCGWDISGQRALFDRLHPGQIGISLNDSFLMTPLKSVSGVLVAGHIDIHLFKARFSYCPSCKNRSCVGRMERLVAENAAGLKKLGA